MKTTQLPEYFQITECIEAFYDQHGDSPQGMGWPNVPDAMRRHQVMLEVIREDYSEQNPVRLLDLGCGCGQFYEFLQARKALGINYTGIDLSERFISQCRSKFPSADFRQLDVLQTPELLEEFDYVVLNGVFTMKCSMAFEQMWQFVQRLLQQVFRHASRGVAFNAMANHVDWQRDDLFHLPLDLLAPFLCQNLSRQFVIRNDYGLYEFCTYIYRSPSIERPGAS
jgi:SAM-dependent methyltransferase